MRRQQEFIIDKKSSARKEIKCFLVVSLLFICKPCLNFLGYLLPRKKGKRLYTCAVRPAAIYGPGEERHLPRIVSMAKLGLLHFKIGGFRAKTDWIYVDNLVLAIILASMGLLDDIPGNEGRPVAAGQPYFVSDGNEWTRSLKIYNTLEHVSIIIFSI